MNAGDFVNYLDVQATPFVRFTGRGESVLRGVTPRLDGSVFVLYLRLSPVLNAYMHVSRTKFKKSKGGERKAHGKEMLRASEPASHSDICRCDTPDATPLENIVFAEEITPGAPA